MKLLNMEQCKENLCQWHEHFTKVTEEIEGIILHEKIVAFQQGLRDEEFLKILFIDPPTSFVDFMARA